MPTLKNTSPFLRMYEASSDRAAKFQCGYLFQASRPMAPTGLFLYRNEEYFRESPALSDALAKATVVVWLNNNIEAQAPAGLLADAWTAVCSPEPDPKTFCLKMKAFELAISVFAPGRLFREYDQFSFLIRDFPDPRALSVIMRGEEIVPVR